MKLWHPPRPASVCVAFDAAEDAKAGGLDRAVYVSMLQELSTLKIRFYIDPKTKDPHIHRHKVTEQEVEEVLSHPGEDRIGHEGARVAIGQTRSVHAMQDANIPVTYLLYTDGGHGFYRPENRLPFYAVTEAFLARSSGRAVRAHR